MKFTYKKSEDIPATILDRFAVAFLSAVLGFISGLIIWAFLAGLNHGGVSFIVLPFSWVWWFTSLMALLGFFLLENFLANFYGYLWHGILFILGIDPKYRL